MLLSWPIARAVRLIFSGSAETIRRPRPLPLIFEVAFATGLAALAPGCVTGWHRGGWLRLWSEEQESFVRKLASAISVERSHR